MLKYLDKSSYNLLPIKIRDISYNPNNKLIISGLNLTIRSKGMNGVSTGTVTTEECILLSLMCTIIF